MFEKMKALLSAARCAAPAYCPYCGAMLMPGMKICPHCGAPVPDS